MSPAALCAASDTCLRSGVTGWSLPSLPAAIWVKPEMTVSMLLKSCAMPPASVPMASSFCDCRRCRLAFAQRLLDALSLADLVGEHLVGSRELRAAPFEFRALPAECRHQLVERLVERANLLRRILRVELLIHPLALSAGSHEADEPAQWPQQDRDNNQLHGGEHTASVPRDEVRPQRAGQRRAPSSSAAEAA